MCRDREFQMKTFVKKLFFPLIIFLASTKIAFAPIRGLQQLTETQGAVTANLKQILGAAQQVKGVSDAIVRALQDQGLDPFDAQGNLNLNDMVDQINQFKTDAQTSGGQAAQLQALLTKAQNDLVDAAQDAQAERNRADQADQAVQRLTLDNQNLQQALTETERDLADRINAEQDQNEILLQFNQNVGLNLRLAPTP